MGGCELYKLVGTVLKRVVKATAAMQLPKKTHFPGYANYLPSYGMTVLCGTEFAKSAGASQR